MKNINTFILLTIVTLFVSCSQKQFAFRKTIKSKSKEQVSIVVPKNKKSEIISIQVVDAKKPDLEKVKQTQIETRKIKKSNAKNILHQLNTIRDKQPTKITLKEKVYQKKLEIKHKLEGESNGLAIAGFVCSIVGLVIFGFILGVLAVIFSAIGLKRAEAGAKGRGFAIAGLIIGIIDIIGAAIFISRM